jgi:hypothetical protein
VKYPIHKVNSMLCKWAVFRKNIWIQEGILKEKMLELKVIWLVALQPHLDALHPVVAAEEAGLRPLIVCMRVADHCGTTNQEP